MIGLYHFLSLAGVMFLIGAVGVLIRKNALIILMSLEMMLNAANIALIAFARFTGNIDMQVAVFVIMTIAAAEVAVGLAIILKVFGARRTINVDALTSLKR
ncbi:MAG: NADH-quinone oxidoreductase subunit NuoK [Deltaproteobacteria bacterium]|nr:NADH-quinone oxidoreductase subunit NuoK [Deltaproteobacteria bacterium]